MAPNRAKIVELQMLLHVVFSIWLFSSSSSFDSLPHVPWRFNSTSCIQCRHVINKCGSSMIMTVLKCWCNSWCTHNCLYKCIIWPCIFGCEHEPDLAAVIKSAASAASRNPRGAQPPAVVHLPGRRPWAPPLEDKSECQKKCQEIDFLTRFDTKHWTVHYF